jgi:hypothetical protein
MKHMPVKPQKRRTRTLPDPELVSLMDSAGSPYADSPEGWWTDRGGALDTRSGVVYFPPGSNPPPCPFPCDSCQRKGRQ